MLRITERGSIWMVEGKIAGEAVDELLRALGDASPGGPRLTLDLAGVSFIDANGIRALRALRGVELRNRSPFIAELLDGGEP